MGTFVSVPLPSAYVNLIFQQYVHYFNNPYTGPNYTLGSVSFWDSLGRPNAFVINTTTTSGISNGWNVLSNGKIVLGVNGITISSPLIGSPPIVWETGNLPPSGGSAWKINWS